MREFGEIAERLRRSTVQVFSHGHDGGGSGTIWSSDGRIVTNSHVARAEKAEVVLWDGRKLAAPGLARRTPRSGGIEGGPPQAIPTRYVPVNW